MLENSQNHSITNYFDNELNIENAAAIFKALGDPTRLRIILALAKGPLNVSKLTDLVNVSQPAVSHQLQLLRQLNLVKFTREGRNIFYSLADQHVNDILGEAFEHVSENDEN